MSVEFAQLNRESKYRFHCITRDKSMPDCKVQFIASHPWDGAYLIVENMDDETDGPKFFGCVREELTEVTQ